MLFFLPLSCCKTNKPPIPWCCAGMGLWSASFREELLELVCMTSRFHFPLPIHAWNPGLRENCCFHILTDWSTVWGKKIGWRESCETSSCNSSKCVLGLALTALFPTVGDCWVSAFKHAELCICIQSDVFSVMEMLPNNASCRGGTY